MQCPGLPKFTIALMFHKLISNKENKVLTFVETLDKFKLQ